MGSERCSKVGVLAESYFNLEFSAFSSEPCLLHALVNSMFKFTCVFESAYPGQCNPFFKKKESNYLKLQIINYSSSKNFNNHFTFVNESIEQFSLVTVKNIKHS